MGKRGSDHFERFADHTILKHQILRAYLGTWSAKLLQWGKAGHRVWFVDGFAGAGGDQLGNPGSPLIAARVAQSTIARLSKTLPNPTIHILACETQPLRFRQLDSAFARFDSSRGLVIQRYPRPLSDVIDSVFQEAGDEPILFFLDPFGVRGLRQALFKTALSGPHNEVFALFADPGAYRLLSVIAASEKDPELEVQRALAQPNLFVEYEVADEAAVKSRVAASSLSFQRTREAARTIIVDALGAEAMRVVDEAPQEQWQAKAVDLYMRSLAEAGARYILPLRVRDANGVPKYYLIHASKSPSGMQAMKEAIGTALGKSDLPQEALRRIVLDTSVDIDPVLQSVRRFFTGMTVRWSIGKNRSSTSVRGYALRHTPIFPSQLDELRDALACAGLVKTARPMTLRFPRLEPTSGA